MSIVPVELLPLFERSFFVSVGYEGVSKVWVLMLVFCSGFVEKFLLVTSYIDFCLRGMTYFLVTFCLVFVHDPLAVLLASEPVWLGFETSFRVVFCLGLVDDFLAVLLAFATLWLGFETTFRVVFCLGFVDDFHVVLLASFATLWLGFETTFRVVFCLGFVDDFHAVLLLLAPAEVLCLGFVTSA